MDLVLTDVMSKSGRAKHEDAHKPPCDAGPSASPTVAIQKVQPLVLVS
jgi:hypothetical protein